MIGRKAVKYILWYYAHAAGQAEIRRTRGTYDTLDAAIAASDQRNAECWRQVTSTSWQLTDKVVKAAGLRHSWWFIDYAKSV